MWGQPLEHGPTRMPDSDRQPRLLVTTVPVVMHTVPLPPNRRIAGGERMYRHPWMNEGARDAPSYAEAYEHPVTTEDRGNERNCLTGSP